MKKIAILLVLLSSHLLADESRVEFTTTEGTWISLDVHPGGQRLVFELLGDLYELPIDGGVAQLLLSGRAFQSQPRFSPDGNSLTFISDESAPTLTTTRWVSCISSSTVCRYSGTRR